MSGDHNMNKNDFNPDWLCTCGDLTTLGVVHRKDAPCYYPDKREWVGLTDDEVCDLWSWSATAEAERTANTQQHAFYRAIEAKLKEKNT